MSPKITTDWDRGLLQGLGLQQGQDGHPMPTHALVDLEGSLLTFACPVRDRNAMRTVEGGTPLRLDYGYHAGVDLAERLPAAERSDSDEDVPIEERLH